jgi:hypothetical protein
MGCGQSQEEIENKKKNEEIENALKKEKLILKMLLLGSTR